MGRGHTLGILACLIAFGATGCDQLGIGGSKKKDSSSKADKDDDDDDDKPKKKKKKDKGEEDEGDGDAAEKKGGDGAGSMAVPNVAGFVVPKGGTHNHVDETFGSNRLVFESMTYPLKDFPRDKLRADFLSVTKGAGWTCTAKGSADYDCQKDGALVGVLFGEAGADETKINVFAKAGSASAPPGGPAPAGGGTVFAGTYSSAWGPVIFTQKAAEPTKVLGRYPRGSLVCVPADTKLECTWAESGSSGRAVFRKESDGNMPGTWGSGASATSGGAWNLKLTTPGTIE